MSDRLMELLPGAEKLIRLYGRCPSFHDAEIVELRLERSGVSAVRIHAFVMTDRVSETGHFVTEKHAVVTFLLEGIPNCELYGFNRQNVISGLEISAAEDGYKLTLFGCYGLEGNLVTSKLSIDVEPGVPPDSMYASHVSRMEGTL